MNIVSKQTLRIPRTKAQSWYVLNTLYKYCQAKVRWHLEVRELHRQYHIKKNAHLEEMGRAYGKAFPP